MFYGKRGLAMSKLTAVDLDAALFFELCKEHGIDPYKAARMALILNSGRVRSNDMRAWAVALANEEKWAQDLCA